MTYVSGVVQDWLQVALEQEDQGVHHAWLYSWPSFVKEMHTCFGIPDIIVEAAHSLDHLRINPDDRIATYNVAFLWYSVMNIKWDYSYYQPWSDNEWLVDEMIAMREEMLMVQNEDITMQ